MEYLEITVLGVMSGTSLDGIDFAIVKFVQANGWSFEVMEATTVPYSTEWGSRLKTAVTLDAKNRALLDIEYTLFLGERITFFLAEHQGYSIDFVSSHGHTVLHQPQQGVTHQMGNLSSLAQTTAAQSDLRFQNSRCCPKKGKELPWFRVQKFICFNSYDACVNLGGFANISILKGNTPKSV